MAMSFMEVVMAGQIAGLVKDSRSCKEIIEGICQEMKEIILTQAEKNPGGRVNE